jgi:hypothetical protein
VLLEVFWKNVELCIVFLLAATLILLPFNWKIFLRNMHYKTPLLVKFLVLAVAIQLSIQLTDAEVQPFIYFQF